MAERSAIEWTDATVNFWWGCTKVGPGCAHCYAEALSERFGGGMFGVGAPRRKIKGAVGLIHRLDNAYSWFYADNDRRRRAFIQSMSDLFDVEVPLEWFDEAWRHIKICRHLDMQIVTKRISVVEKRLAAVGETTWSQHAGLMISVVNQAEADRDIPRLLALKAKLGIPWVGLSVEPMLGSIVLRDEWLALLDWVIVGGESGGRARPMHPDWARALRDQCIAAGVPFNFKQHGEWREWDNGSPEPEEIENDSETADAIYASAIRPAFVALDGRVFTRADLPEEIPCRLIERVGKKAAGRLLDGVEHNGFPGAI